RRPWCASEKAEQGAFAAFLGVEIDAHKSRWTALAVGDCCLMQVDDVGKGMRAVETSPLQRSSQFTMSPYLIGSRSDGESLKDRIQVSKGSLRDEIGRASCRERGWREVREVGRE